MIIGSILAFLVGSFLFGKMFGARARREEWVDQWNQPIDHGNGNIETFEHQLERTQNYGMHGPSPFKDWK